LVKGKGLKAGQVVTVSLANIEAPKPKVETPSELTNQQTDLAVPQPGRGK
jgi:hypothetical protein